MPMFHKVGLYNLRMSRDGGQSWPFVGSFYVLAPERSSPKVFLIDDSLSSINRWDNPAADQLVLSWQALNLTTDINARIDINLWGYWEDAFKSHWNKIDTVAEQQTNNGFYSFSPKTIMRNPLIRDAWKKYHFGLVQVKNWENFFEKIIKILFRSQSTIGKTMG